MSAISRRTCLKPGSYSNSSYCRARPRNLEDKLLKLTRNTISATLSTWGRISPRNFQATSTRETYYPSIPTSSVETSTRPTWSTKMSTTCWWRWTPTPRGAHSGSILRSAASGKAAISRKTGMWILIAAGSSSSTSLTSTRVTSRDSIRMGWTYWVGCVEMRKIWGVVGLDRSGYTDTWCGRTASALT